MMRILLGLLATAAAFAFASVPAVQAHAAESGGAQAAPLLFTFRERGENELPRASVGLGYSGLHIAVVHGWVQLVDNVTGRATLAVWDGYHTLLLEDGKAVGVRNVITSRERRFGERGEIGAFFTTVPDDDLAMDVPPQCRGPRATAALL